MTNFKIKFLKCDIKKDELNSIFGQAYPIEDEVDGYVYSPADSVKELVIRKSDGYLLHKSDAVYVRNWADVKKLFSLPSEGGLSKLIKLESFRQLEEELNLRLADINSLIKDRKAVYIFSAHRNGKKVIDYCALLGIKVLGFIDNDPQKINSSFNGYPIFSLESIDKGAIIINASGRYSEEIENQLSSIGYKNRLGFMEFLYLYNLPFQAHGSFSEFVENVFFHKNELISLYLALHDEKSMRVLDNFLLYKMTLEFGFVGKTVSLYEQEFFAEDILTYRNSEVFVDGGAYDGDSFMRFVAHCRDFKRAYLFEPDSNIAQIANKLTVADARVSVVNAGVYSETKKLRFSVTGGMNGAISDDGEIEIDVVAIDDYVNESISHIKLDVEGAEVEALYGAKNKIEEGMPKIAVAIYHKPDDLWGIPALIEQLGHGRYQFDIRHYSQTLDDVILYATPMER